MLSFSSQPHFLCPPCEGGHGNLFVQKGPLFVVRLLGFWGFFFSNTAGLWGRENQKRNDLGLPKVSVDWDFSAGHCLAFYLCWRCCLVAQVGFQSPPRICSVRFFCSLLFFFFFGGRGGTFSFSPGWMDTLCSQGVEGLLPLGFSGIDDTLWTQI